MLEAYIIPQGHVDFDEAIFPFQWEVEEQKAEGSGLVNRYELCRSYIWGEAPHQKFHQYLAKRKNQQTQNFCHIAIRESTPKQADEQKQKEDDGLAQRKILSERQLMPELVKLAESVLSNKSHECLPRIRTLSSVIRSSDETPEDPTLYQADLEDAENDSYQQECADGYAAEQWLF